MRRIVIAALTTVSGLVMLFSYYTSTNSGGGAVAVRKTGTGPTVRPARPPAAGQPTGGSSGASSGRFANSGTFTGDPADTQWGVVQVQITIRGGRIVGADAIQYPNGNFRDQEINSYAVPALDHEVLDAQSAEIDAISGATVTSGGYLTSLQSAVDAAHR